jgi:hypothetical protein
MYKNRKVSGDNSSIYKEVNTITIIKIKRSPNEINGAPQKMQMFRIAKLTSG